MERFEAAEALGQRAARLVERMLRDNEGRLFITDASEINNVLIEAEQRGWLR